MSNATDHSGQLGAERISHPKQHLADPNCNLCAGQGWIIVDASERRWLQERYQWAVISTGSGDCPCVQMADNDSPLPAPPKETAR